MASERRISQVATTIPVRNVQALAACSADELTAEALDRYIRPDIDQDAVLEEHSDELPVIDLGRLLNPESWEEEAAKLRFACEEWGFFQVLNHGVPEEVVLNIKRDIQEFFKLPLEIKNLYAQQPGDLQGYGQAYVVSNDQKLDWADMFAIIAQPPEARDMKRWPAQPLTFRKSLEDYSDELKKVAGSIATTIGKILNIEPELMDDKYAVQAVRMNYYPPCTSMSKMVLGFSPHSDGSFFTILTEVNSVKGLQIRRHGAWIPVKPHPNALLVNVGDLLEIMTNGRYKSIEHRVTINAQMERLSISAFHNPKFDGVVSPVLGSTTEKVLYKTVSVGDYIKYQLSNKLDGKKALDHAKIDM
ncbi:unnamed protein product [Urochloa decumbens]|uniref:Fe2OG dioxygenase domain-containing protein n=1 Tax=Urochloa decumbens TaxID=240449 RepID=A0ABC9GEK9_9POAL